MKSIVEYLEFYSRVYPKRLCIVDIWGETTYEEMWKKVKKVAKKYVDLGIKKNDCIVVECTQNTDYIVCDLACSLIEAIFVPVENKVAEENLKNIIQDTEAVLVISGSKYFVGVDILDINDIYNSEDELYDIAFPAENSTTEILYTTGTTGKSKGIEITNRNNIALAENIKYGTEMKEENVELIPLPLSHSHGLRCCYANLLNGGTCVLIEGITQVKKIFELIIKYKITALDLSPSAVLILIKLLKNRIEEFRNQIDYIQIGTAVLPEETKKLLIEKFPNTRLYNFYGSTESGRTCVYEFNNKQERKGCIGKPTKNAKFIVTDTDRNPIVSSKENPGLLATEGKMNMKGYWKQPELTKEIMKNGYVFSNDLGYIDEEGYIYIWGRKDDVINCGGIKISPDEIEEIVTKNSKIKDCACVPKTDVVLGQVPQLFIVVKDCANFVMKEFIEELNACIETVRMPKEIIIVEEIPRTYNGKIQRKKLVDMYQ